PLPLVLWHGLGDNFAADGVNNVLDLASTIHPGTVTYAIRLGDDASSDRSSSYFGNTTSQIEAVCDAITSHPVLSKAPAIDALGSSQGGLLLRGMIQRCGDRVKVRSLVTFGSPHSGISTFQDCEPTNLLCHFAFGLLQENTWSRFIQGRLVPAQYYRTLNESTGEPTEEYLKYSNLLADVNNERGVKNETYKDHLSRLERFVMYRFEEEDAVIPPESTWFADVWQKPAPDGDEGTDERIVTPLKERKMYEEDWLGLRKLDEKDALEFRTIPGKHMQIGKEVLRDAFKNYFGP
ncbi:palmitoyl-protein thioesterase 1 precursor, partial [Viridothelium virens]